MSVRVKTCGITNLEDARAAIDAGADALGFNFYARSPRYVAPSEARRICSQLPETICRVGIFVNAARDDVKSLVETVGLTAIQFHGDETPADCRDWACKVIKAVRVRERACVVGANDYDADFILADAHVEGTYGGSGHRVDLALLKAFDASRLIVAGGLTPDNVAEVVRAVRPFGVDAASGIERSPGKKDWDLMRRFIENANAA